MKRYANVEGYQVLISMIDENVNHSIQDSINELKSQLVSKVIINVPLEAEAAQKIATDNDDIVCLFLDVDPYSSVFNVSFNPADGTRASVKYLYELGHRDIAFIELRDELAAQHEEHKPRQDESSDTRTDPGPGPRAATRRNSSCRRSPA